MSGTLFSSLKIPSLTESSRSVMSDWIEVEPAYGRDYTTAGAAKADWKRGKDFRETSRGSYVTKAEAERLGLSVIIRYSQSRKVTGTK